MSRELYHRNYYLAVTKPRKGHGDRRGPKLKYSVSADINNPCKSDPKTTYARKKLYQRPLWRLDHDIGHICETIGVTPDLNMRKMLLDHIHEFLNAVYIKEDATP